MLITDAVVIKQEEIIPGYYRMVLSAGEAAKKAKPGQFLHVRCTSTLDPLLRRPISIHAVDRGKGEIFLFYRVVGRGTALLAAKAKGDSLNVLGPLGRGFTMPGGSGRVVVAAGGIGIAPLYFFLQELSAIKICADVFLGAATKKQLFFSSEIAASGHNVFPATDDGTAGYHGTAVDLFAQNLSDINSVYCCGPAGMLKKLGQILREHNIHGQVSLEERMGCGVGACLSCACKTAGDGENYRYSRVCLDGPVFPVGKVVWE